MFFSASTTTTLSSFLPMAPPAEESMAFFSDRDLASKMGKSTHALYVSIETMVLLKPSSSHGSAIDASPAWQQVVQLRNMPEQSTSGRPQWARQLAVSAQSPSSGIAG